MSKRRAGFTESEWRCLSGLAHPYTVLAAEAGVPRVALQEGLAHTVGQGVGRVVGRVKHGRPARPEPHHFSTEVPAATSSLTPSQPDASEPKKSGGKKADSSDERIKRAAAKAKAAKKKRAKPHFGTGDINPFFKLGRAVLKLGPGTAMPLVPSVKRKSKNEDLLWGAFLDECQVNEDAFYQLVAEAERGEDIELVDEVLAFEEAFSVWVEGLDPELVKAAGADTVDNARKVAPDNEQRVTKILRNVVRLRKRLAGEPEPGKYLRKHGAKEDLERLGIPLQEWSTLAGLSDAYAISEDVEEDLDAAPTWVQAKAKTKEGRIAALKSRHRKLKAKRGLDLLARYARNAGKNK